MGRVWSLGVGVSGLGWVHGFEFRVGTLQQESYPTSSQSQVWRTFSCPSPEPRMERIGDGPQLLQRRSVVAIDQHV